MQTHKFPTASVVSRALRRDAGIITRPFPKIGYSVHGGSFHGPSIWVYVSDAAGINIRRAKALHEHLIEVGWKVTLAEDSSILYVDYVPTAKEVNE